MEVTDLPAYLAQLLQQLEDLYERAGREVDLATRGIEHAKKNRLTGLQVQAEIELKVWRGVQADAARLLSREVTAPPPSRKKTVSDLVRRFKPGVYQHWKGGHYAALHLAMDHETREPSVVYVSFSHARGNGSQPYTIRPLASPVLGVESWTDLVRPGTGELVMTALEVGQLGRDAALARTVGSVRRFTYIGDG